MPIQRPGADEFAPFYAGYIAQLPPETDVVDALERQRAAWTRFLGALPKDRWDHRYAPDKWTVREVAGHLIDTERIMSYRALRIARGDTTPLPGFDENAYVPAGEFGRRPLGELAEEYDHVRRATIAFARSLTPETAARRGTSNGKTVSTRALCWIIPGHERHHWNVLGERYGLRVE